ncbi:MAG: PEP-CTERM sorting domain-containing protein, partial [Candidatus Dormibacteria bacterium]
SWVVFGGGVTKPSVGSAYAPDLHFGAFGLGIGDLKVSFSDDGFAGSGGSTDFLTEFGADLGGVVPGDSSLTLSSWSTAGGLAQLGPFFGPGAYSASEMDAQTLTGSYGLTLYADLTHSALAVSSFDASVKEVPEPGTLCLFGAGLLGAAFFVRRRRMPALASTRV